MKTRDRATGSSVLVQGFKLALEVEGLRPRTVKNYVRDTGHFLRATNKDPRDVDAQDVRAYLAGRQEHCAPKTVRESQLALRRFFRFLVADGEVTVDPVVKLSLPSAGSPEPQPTFSEAEVKRLLLTCNTRTLDGLRNRALVLTLFDCGVRTGELVSMEVPDWEQRQARVSGKTGVRNVPFGIATLQAVERYVRKWRISEGPLWRGKKGPLTGSGVLQLVERLCRQAGVEHKGVHAFRRAAAAQMKRLGMNDSDILEVMGWKDVTMLRRYTATVAEELAHLAHRQHSPADALDSWKT